MVSKYDYQSPQFETYEDYIRHALSMQTFASLRPEKITFGPMGLGWRPKTTVDRLVFQNMIRNQPIEKSMAMMPVAMQSLFDKYTKKFKVDPPATGS